MGTLIVKDIDRVGRRVKNLHDLITLADQKRSIIYLIKKGSKDSPSGIFMRSPAAWVSSWPARMVYNLLKVGMYIYKPVDSPIVLKYPNTIAEEE